MSLEVLLIAEHKTIVPYGYNVLLGGNLGRTGRKHSKETCLKLSQLATERGMPRSTREKAWVASKGNKWNIGLVRSEETRRKISETKKAQNRPSWNRGLKMPSLLGNSHARGYRHTEEAKELIAQAALGNKHFPKTRGEKGRFSPQANCGLNATTQLI